MGLFRTINFIIRHPLNAGNTIKALSRFVQWQIVSKIHNGDIIIDWINGTKFIARKGETAMTGNIYCGLREFCDMSFLLHVLEATDLFIDVGANVGAYTILACGANGAKGYAFEPIPSTFKRLMNNILINRMQDRVKCCNIGVGDCRDKLFFTKTLGTINHVVKNAKISKNTVEVDVYPLDEILKEECPAMIKIDVEGYETLVLKGAGNILGKESLHSVIMELNGSGERYGFNEEDILKKMLGYGFKTYSYDPFKRELQDLKGKNLHSGNTLFVRNLEYLEKKLKDASKFIINGIEI